MERLNFLFVGAAIVIMVFLSGCNTPYITSDGERLLSNSVVGCAVGQVFFDDCGAGAAVAAGATIIDDQTK
jgi:uncharacterized membrane protein (DUF441 family)|tara:strand:+ start:278 stop:490 length:213 start_codon:yes stop_codon:yes gene_type:complete